jgi:TRAP-type mannitol/chloroaromatic compound transport system permease small subunit
VSPLLRLSNWIDRGNAAVAKALAIPLAGMILVGSYNALARYSNATARRLQPGAEVLPVSNALLELQWYAFAVVFLFGSAHALKRGDHVRVDVLYAGLPTRGRRWVDLVGSFIFVVPFCLFGAVMAVPFALESIGRWEASPDPSGLPRWPLKAILPLAFLGIALQGLANGIRGAAALRGAVSDGVSDE